MKISVDRTHGPEGELIFTITAKNPRLVDFSVNEQSILMILDAARLAVDQVPNDPTGYSVREKVIQLIHNTKRVEYDELMRQLKFHIRNELQIKFDPICQEIYNWVYDAQEKPLKAWLEEFDPRRTKYYFDNDKEMQNNTETDSLDDNDEDDDEDSEF